ncbi:hypothetical protein PROFUN_14936 [Planoprotostelium fungivorum]|uniref:Uncharacterized protein n=1 Tax=Planoprotostelium fungivorum TaxID=1890364 RepID=A0A2P6MYF2_9EUKA|nr:hypothetical protein PROFUN_14936 [Planoprotostelium fungivorum]
MKGDCLKPIRKERSRKYTIQVIHPRESFALLSRVMPRSFKRKGKKSSTPLAKVARTPQSSERSNSKHIEEDSPSVPLSPTSESADKEVASPTGSGERDTERDGDENGQSTQPETEENNHPPGMNRQLYNMINGLQAMLITSVLPRPVTVTATTGAGRQQQVVEPVTPMRARERQELNSPMPQDMRQTEKQPDRPPTVVVREVSQVPEEVTTTTEKEIALPASDLLIANQVGLGLPQSVEEAAEDGIPILIGNNNINNNTLRTWMHNIDYRWHAFREDNKSLMLLFIRGIESKNHALQNYTMSFTSTLPIKSWDEFLAGVWHLLYDVNAMEKAIQKYQTIEKKQEYTT